MNLGIDFGTTNSTIAWYNPATFRQETVEIGGQARIPSLVCWASERADRLFGAEARAEAANAENWETEARLQFRDRLASSFKTDFAAGHASVSSLNLGTNVSPDSVVEAYLAWLLAQFREATGTAETEPIRATFTHPATQEWTQSGPQSPCARLERIARKAGFGTVRLELEPIAAFREAERRGIDLGKGVLVFDLGGGTLDLVYFRRDDDGSWGAPFLATDVPLSSVWNSDYESVYHMVSPNDSSASALHFTTDKTPTNGVVGVGRKMGASGGLVTEEHPVEGMSGPFTISGWLCGYASMGNSYVLLKCVGGSEKQFGILFGYVPMTLQLYMPSAANPGSGTQGSDIRYTHSLVELPDEGWHHFAYTYDGAVFGAYLDGSLVRQREYNFTQCGHHPSLQIGTLRVGRSPGGGDLFKGGLDELRLETVGRSADWIKACYDDQRGALTTISFRPAGIIMSLR